MFNLFLLAIFAKKFGSSRATGALRVAGYAGAITVALGAIGVHKARAAFEEKGVELGADMTTLASLVQNANTFTLNGQRIHLGTATTLDGANTVLDKFEASCKAAEGEDVPVWSSIPERTDEEKAKNQGLAPAIPILRTQNAHGGTIVCIVPTAASAPHSARAFAAQIEAFSTTGHLSELGKLRYAFVTEGATGTSVATVWTDDEFDLSALAPEHGSNTDTPGTDPALMARPEAAQRLLTGTVEGMPYRIFAYKVQGTPQSAIADYDTQMIKKGWMSINDPNYQSAPHEDAEIRAYMVRDGRQGYVVAFSDKEHHTMMGVVEVGPEGLAKMPAKPAADSDGF